MRLARLMSAAAAAWVAVAGSPAMAQDPLDATFRCRVGAACATDDVIVGDGQLESGFDFHGYHTTVLSGKGKQSTTYIDGAFVNGPGGIDIGLARETVDRTLVFKFGNAIWTGSALPAACQVAGKTIAANGVDFRFTVFEGSTAIGVEALAPGDALDGNPDGSGHWVGGVVNFTISPDVQGALFFNYSKDSVTPWDGSVSLSRSADGSTYVLTSTSTVLLQCTASGKGKPITANATYDVPFQLTVQK